MKRKWILIVCIAFVLCLTLSGCSEEEEKILSGKYHVNMEIKGYGTVKLELDADAAPLTVTNFVNLVKKKFYDGLTFYRIADGFVIEGGDPLKDGRGGSKETIKGEFSANGVQNPISHERGTISMVRRDADYNCASSPFFIVLEDAPQLDGNYAAFGYVTDGMDIIDKICDETSVEDDNGMVSPDNQPVIKKIKVVK